MKGTLVNLLLLLLLVSPRVYSAFCLGHSLRANYIAGRDHRHLNLFLPGNLEHCRCTSFNLERERESESLHLKLYLAAFIYLSTYLAIQLFLKSSDLLNFLFLLSLLFSSQSQSTYCLTSDG